MCPFLRVVLVNQQSSNPFEELPMVHEPLGHFVFHSKHVLKGHFWASNYLFKNDSHTERWVLWHGLKSFLCEFFRHARDCSLFHIFKSLYDLLNWVWFETVVNFIEVRDWKFCSRVVRYWVHDWFDIVESWLLCRFLNQFFIKLLDSWMINKMSSNSPLQYFRPF